MRALAGLANAAWLASGLGDRLRLLITTGQGADSVPYKDRVIEVRDGQLIEVRAGRGRRCRPQHRRRR